MKFTTPNGKPAGDHCFKSKRCAKKLKLRYRNISDPSSGAHMDTSMPAGSTAVCRHGTTWIVVREDFMTTAWRRADHITPPPPTQGDWVADPSVDQLIEHILNEDG